VRHKDRSIAVGVINHVGIAGIPSQFDLRKNSVRNVNPMETIKMRRINNNIRIKSRRRMTTTTTTTIQRTRTFSSKISRHKQIAWHSHCHNRLAFPLSVG
jgi:hypothetical protein